MAKPLILHGIHQRITQKLDKCESPILARRSQCKLTTNRNNFLNTTNFVAFENAFFDIIGPDAKIEHVITFPTATNHEASCFVPEQNALFFAAWGFDHSWQYLLDATTLQLKNITTDPPTLNAHGCVYYQGSLHIATDGGEPGQYASLVQVNATTLKAKTLLNNFYQQPFLGFNDLDIDPNGNFWITDSISAWVSKLLSLSSPS